MHGPTAGIAGSTGLILNFLYLIILEQITVYFLTLFDLVKVPQMYWIICIIYSY